MPVSDEDLFEGVQIPKQPVHAATFYLVKNLIVSPLLIISICVIKVPGCSSSSMPLCL